MNDAAYVDYGPPVTVVTSSPLWVNARPGEEQYWAWNDPRWGAWGLKPEDVRYQISDQWEALLKQAGFQGEIYRPWTYTQMNEYGGWDEIAGGLTFTDAAKRAIDTLRARGYDFRRKHPDRRTFNTYWGFFGPDGLIQDIKIAGDDGSANLFKAVMFLAPVWLGPLAGALSVPTPVLSAGINIAAGADPLRAIAGAALPVVAQTIMPAVSVLPDTSIGPILPPTEWLDTGAALPTIDTGFVGPVFPGADLAAELLTAPQLLPELAAPVIEPAPQFLIEPPRLDVQPVIDPVEAWGPTIETVPVIEAQPLPIFEAQPLPIFEPEPLPVFEVEPLPIFEAQPLPVFEAQPLPVFEPEPLPVFEPVALPPPAYQPETVPNMSAEEEPWWVKILRQWQMELDQQFASSASIEPVPQPLIEPMTIPEVPAMPAAEINPFAGWTFEPEPWRPRTYEVVGGEIVNEQFLDVAMPAPVVELPAIETMAPIPTIDVAAPNIEPVEVFTQPTQVPTVYEDEYLYNVPENNLFPVLDLSAVDTFSGAEMDQIFGPPTVGAEAFPGEVYPPAYDVVTIDEASQLSTDILVGGNGGGVVEVGGNFLPAPSPANPDLSVGQILKDANAIMLDALKLVRSWRQLTNPPSPNRVAQARVGSSTVRALPNGMIETTDASGRVTRKRPPVGQPQMTTDGSMVVNNGDGTYTSISPSGASATMRYPADGTAAAPGGYSTALLIGGAVLALAVLS